MMAPTMASTATATPTPMPAPTHLGMLMAPIHHLPALHQSELTLSDLARIRMELGLDALLRQILLQTSHGPQV